MKFNEDKGKYIFDESLVQKKELDYFKTHADEFYLQFLTKIKEEKKEMGWFEWFRSWIQK